MQKKQYLATNQKPDEKPEAAKARTILTPSIAAGLAIANQHTGIPDDVSVMGLANEIARQTKAINDGDMRGCEELLVAQSVTLNVMFNHLAALGAAYIKNPDMAETLYRLAFRAQAQSRANIEALTDIKFPRTVAYVQQANIAQGPQQVNNAPAPKLKLHKSKLSERLTDELRPHTRTPRLASKANTTLEAVGKINRPKINGRKKESVAQPRQRKG